MSEGEGDLQSKTTGVDRIPAITRRQAMTWLGMVGVSIMAPPLLLWEKQKATPGMADPGANWRSPTGAGEVVTGESAIASNYRMKEKLAEAPGIDLQRSGNDEYSGDNTVAENFIDSLGHENNDLGHIVIDAETDPGKVSYSLQMVKKTEKAGEYLTNLLPEVMRDIQQLADEFKQKYVTFNNGNGYKGQVLLEIPGDKFIVEIARISKIDNSVSFSPVPDSAAGLSGTIGVEIDGVFLVYSKNGQPSDPRKPEVRLRLAHSFVGKGKDEGGTVGEMFVRMPLNDALGLMKSAKRGTSSVIGIFTDKNYPEKIKNIEVMSEQLGRISKQSHVSFIDQAGFKLPLDELVKLGYEEGVVSQSGNTALAGGVCAEVSAAYQATAVSLIRELVRGGNSEKEAIEKVNGYINSTSHTGFEPYVAGSSDMPAWDFADATIWFDGENSQRDVRINLPAGLRVSLTTTIVAKGSDWYGSGENYIVVVNEPVVEEIPEPQRR